MTVGVRRGKRNKNDLQGGMHKVRMQYYIKLQFLSFPPAFWDVFVTTPGGPVAHEPSFRRYHNHIGGGTLSIVDETWRASTWAVLAALASQDSMVMKGSMYVQINI